MKQFEKDLVLSFTGRKVINYVPYYKVFSLTAGDLSEYNEMQQDECLFADFQFNFNNKLNESPTLYLRYQGQVLVQSQSFYTNLNNLQNWNNEFFKSVICNELHILNNAAQSQSAQLIVTGWLVKFA